MKTTKHFSCKYYSLAVFLLLFSLISTSCREEGKGIRYPEPSENPIYLTSNAETKDTWVKNVFGINAENPETDNVEINDTNTSTTSSGTIIENDWIRIEYGNKLAKGVMRITVKENTLPHSRSYILKIYSDLKESKLAIIQAGKQ